MDDHVADAPRRASPPDRAAARLLAAAPRLCAFLLVAVIARGFVAADAPVWRYAVLAPLVFIAWPRRARRERSR